MNHLVFHLVLFIFNCFWITSFLMYKCYLNFTSLFKASWQFYLKLYYYFVHVKFSTCIIWNLWYIDKFISGSGSLWMRVTFHFMFNTYLIFQWELRVLHNNHLFRYLVYIFDDLSWIVYSSVCKCVFLPADSLIIQALHENGNITLWLKWALPFLIWKNPRSSH